MILTVKYFSKIDVFWLLRRVDWGFPALLEVTTNVAAWTELRNLKMFYFDALAPPQILAQPTRIDVLYPFCSIVALLLVCGRNIKPLDHQTDTFGT